MSDRPLIFISAVSAEHRSLRTTVAALLDHEGYDTDFEDVFDTEHGDITEMLARRLDNCDGVIQLIGQRYGMGLPGPHPQFGECSYTQFEALYARSIGKPVRYILLDPAHPSDAGPAKPDPVPATGGAPAALQAAYRQRIESDTALYHSSKTVAETENCIYRLRPVLEKLREEWRARMERHERELRRLRPIHVIGVLTLIAITVACIYFGRQELQHRRMEERLATGQDSTNDKVDTISRRLDTSLDLIEREMTVYARELRARDKTLADFTPEQVLTELAKRQKTTPEELRLLLDAALTSDDLSTRAQALLIEQQFTEAAALFRKAGDAKVARLKAMQDRTSVLAEEIALDYLREGVAYDYKLDYPSAIAAYESALNQISRTSHALTWAMVQVDLANALSEYGMRTDPVHGNALLSRAVTAYRAALEIYTLKAQSHDWAMTQGNLAATLQTQGIRSKGQIGQELLEEAVSTCRAALTVYTREALPQDWARTQNTLAATIVEQGIRSEGQARQELLGQAVGVYRAALEVFTREAYPQDWAQTQNNLGLALLQLGSQIEGLAAQELLGQAVSVYRAVLEVFAREPYPQEWARTQNNLGLSLREQGIRRVEKRAGLEVLGQAISAFRAALEIYTREALPQDWARTQNNMAVALRDQGIRSEGQAGQELLGQAANAYRAALEVYTRAILPVEWAMTKTNLAGVLQTQAKGNEGQAGQELLGQAVSAYRDVLDVFTRGTLPQYWAATQNNLGAALEAQGDNAAASAQEWFYREAEAAYLAALEVYTKEASPHYHGMAQRSLLRLRAKMAK